jgi:protein SCO1/2
MSRFALFASIAALVLAFAAVVFVIWDGRLRHPAPITTVTGTAQVGGPFSLMDQHGNRVTDKDLRGKYWLVYFGFTYCPDICPTTLQEMSEAIERLGPTGEKVVPVFVTVDPERDTVPQMASYAAHFHPRLLALTGTPEEIAAVSKTFRVYAAKVSPEGRSVSPGSRDYLMDHSSILYLMGPDGKFVSFFSHDADAAAIAEGLRRHLG